MKRRFFVGGLALLLLGVGAAGAYVQQATQRVEGEYFDSNGVRLHYTVEGEGEPVILVHGFAANADNNWRLPGITPVLAENFQVIALDNRGHGLSDKPHTADAYGTEMVEDVVRLMDHLEIEKAHVVGYSMGGFITLKLATMYPDRLLSASPCGMAWQVVDEENSKFLVDLAASLENGGGFDPLFARLAPEGREVSALRSMTINTLLALANDKLALANVIKAFEELAVPEEDLKKISVPMLSVVGSIDPLKEGIEDMHQRVAGHEMILIDGADHLSATGHPGLTEALDQFLKKHSNPSGERESGEVAAAA